MAAYRASIARHGPTGWTPGAKRESTVLNPGGTADALRLRFNDGRILPDPHPAQRLNSNPPPGKRGVGLGRRGFGVTPLAAAAAALRR
ncbi:MAG: hypothetical protein OXF25_05245 [Cyanobacteria bacterium MAG CAR3_bin_5]|nr:hypothetical protein [Cyanobacteria bacterium MAG CAR3_bin_5]